MLCVHTVFTARPQVTVQSRSGLCPFGDIRGGVHMKPFLGVVLAVVSAAVAACGGGATEEECTGGACSTESVEQAALCCWCANPPPGCDDEPPPVPAPTAMRFALGLWNGAPESRVCTLAYSYKSISGSTVSGVLASEEHLPASYWRGGLLEARTGSTVTMTATCQHPNYPTVSIQATRALTTLPMDKERTCRAIYSEAPIPTMTIPCWDGPTIGPVPGLEFVTVVQSNSAYPTTVSLGYVPASDGGGTAGPEISVFNGQSIAASTQKRASIFAPIGGTVRIHFTATTNGVVSGLTTDVVLDDPSAVPIFVINPNGSVFMKKSSF